MALLQQLKRMVERARGDSAPAPARDQPDAASAPAFGFTGGVPNLDRKSDMVEARSDERQDLATTISFPLHWTTPRESWDYLFDLAVACELLGPRPDDLVLDFAAGSCWATEFLNRVSVAGVLNPGRYRLRFDMVVEGVTWFEPHGSAIVERLLEVIDQRRPLSP